MASTAAMVTQHTHTQTHISLKCIVERGVLRDRKRKRVNRGEGLIVESMKNLLFLITSPSLLIQSVLFHLPPSLSFVTLSRLFFNSHVMKT